MGCSWPALPSTSSGPAGSTARLAESRLDGMQRIEVLGNFLVGNFVIVRRQIASRAGHLPVFN